MLDSHKFNNNYESNRWKEKVAVVLRIENNISLL